jgi:endonuclease I
MKKLSVLLLAAITSVCATGCSFEDIFNIFKKDDPKEKVKVESVTLPDEEIMLEVGNSYVMKPTVLPANADQRIIFESDDKEGDIVSVGRDGTVYAVGAGDTNVYAKSAVDSTKMAALYVYVTDPVTCYNVTFNSNGGSGSMVNQTTDGSVFVTPACSFTRSGYHFADWGLQRGNQTEHYGIGTTITDIRSDIVLFANWELDTVENHTVTFNANTGSGTMEAMQTTGSTFVVPECGFTKNLYTFKEWALNSASGKTYPIGSSITNISSDITLYAKWQEQNFTVSFNSNGGTGNMPNQTTQGFSYKVPGSMFTAPAGMTFDCWALNSVSGTQYHADSTISTINSDITLFAIWKEKTQEDEIDDDYTGYYDSITDSLTGTNLVTALNTLNNKKRARTMTYAGLKEWGKYTEIDWTGKDNVSGKMFGFYDNALVANYWDNQATWNREHVWPNSLGGGKVEADMYMPRPCSVKINSARGNKYYGTASSSLYDPGQYEAHYRGVAARIIFYCAIADKSLSVIDANSGGSTSMGKLSDLLRWNLQYLPSKSADAHLTLRIEANRNKEMFSREELQHNRNPFVDHPEYACRIWGNTNSTTKQICGM